MTLESADITAALQRVLASPGFTASPRLSRFLDFIVQRSLNGKAHELKEFVIGLEVFDRSEAYDPRIDSIVRVEATRLRARLDEYYAGEGSGDPVMIRVPRGTYAPVFEKNPGLVEAREEHRAEPDARGVVPAAAPPEATAPPETTAPRNRPRPTAATVRVAAMAAVLALAAVATYSMAGGGDVPAALAPGVSPAGTAAPSPSIATPAANTTPRSSQPKGSSAAVRTTAPAHAASAPVGPAPVSPAAPAAPAAPRVDVAVIPFNHFSANGADEQLAARVTDELTAALARDPRLSVVSAVSARHAASGVRSGRQIAAALGVRMLIEGSVMPRAGGVRITARIIDIAIDRKVAVQELEGDPAGIRELAMRLADQLTAAVAVVPSNR